ncbi:hypothetical protein [Nonomuraea typhae]|uniref:hypothetical protein n=1 Tax=Nonomuraea typhae TaxID=2603600 RepID=UPI0012F9CFEB|nr:hypothetical protein [Nonomuraea typhae]
MRRDLLALTLSAAVPLEMARLRTVDDDRRQLHVSSVLEHFRYPVNPVAAHGDDLLYGGPGCARRFAELATVLACLAWTPGGVTFCGMHFCADHQACDDSAGDPPFFHECGQESSDVVEHGRAAPAAPASEVSDDA